VNQSDRAVTRRRHRLVRISWRLAERSLQAMSKLEPQSKTTVETILAAISAPASGNDEKSEIRATAVKLAVGLKVEPKVMVPALMKALKNDRRHLLTTIDALARLGADARDALPALESLKLDTDKQVQEAGEAAIAKIREK
jgi:hypothetical protein